MLEFGSSLAGVEAALALAETCQPQVRVGVHLGDVMVQPNGDLLGHGVNVAARLMARSEPGSGLVSGAVRQNIRGPVADMTGATDQDYFAEGMLVEIVTALSAFQSLFVIAHAASLTYRGDPRSPWRLALTFGQGIALFHLRRFAEAIPLLYKGIIPVQRALTLRMIASCYGHLGRHQEARAVPGGFAPASPTELRWLNLFRDGSFQAILDEGLALVAGDTAAQSSS